jgi:hypothetical protein
MELGMGIGSIYDSFFGLILTFLDFFRLNLPRNQTLNQKSNLKNKEKNSEKNNLR